MAAVPPRVCQVPAHPHGAPAAPCARRSCAARALLLAAHLGALPACRAYDPAAFDLTAARRSDDLSPEVAAAPRQVGAVSLSEVRFTAAVWDDRGGARPVRLHAFVAVPPGASPAARRPAVIFAHGLGAQADAGTAVELARNLDVVALSLSAPGAGASEGQAPTAADPRALFPTGEGDLRASWLYGYVHGVLRAITYVSTRPEVDPGAVALTGFSMGGVVTLIANGVDDRLRGALPVAAAGGLHAAATEDTWLRRLVQSAGGLSADSPGPRALFRALDPLAYAGRQRGAVYLLTGAQDEYFPLSQALRTYHALRAPDRRLAIVPDYDHGWYFGSGCRAECMPAAAPVVGKERDCPPPPVCPAACPAGASPPYCGPAASYNRQRDFAARWALLLRALVARHVARPPRPFAAPPETPVLTRRDGAVLVRAPGAVRTLRLAISDDCGWTYRQRELTREPDGAYRHREVLSARAIVFAEAEGEEGAVATSVPDWPRGCPVRVRPFGPRP